MRWRVWVQVWRASAHLAGVRRMGCYGVRYRVHGEGPYRALDVAGDDGAEVRHPCRAAFVIVYPDRVLQCHLGRSLRASRFKVLLWVASVTVLCRALMRGSRWFLWCAAARLRAVWRAVLSAGRGA